MECSIALWNAGGQDRRKKNTAKETAEYDKPRKGEQQSIYVGKDFIRPNLSNFICDKYKNKCTLVNR